MIITQDIQLKETITSYKHEPNIGKKAFSYLGPKIWQEVPPETKLCSFTSFKSKLKKYFVNKFVTID